MTTEAKLKVGELHAAHTTLAAVVNENAKMPSKAAYWLARMLKRLEPEAVPAEQSRIALIKEYGEEKDGAISVLPERIPEFMAKWAEITAVESDLVPIKVKIDTLDGVEMTGAQMLAIEKFVEE